MMYVVIFSDDLGASWKYGGVETDSQERAVMAVHEGQRRFPSCLYEMHCLNPNLLNALRRPVENQH